MRRSRPPRTDTDVGAALLLTIGFMLMVGAITAGLTAAVTTSVKHRATLEQIRDREYAADAAVESAVATARAWTCAVTTGSMAPDASINGLSIRVDYASTCSSIATAMGAAYPQRNVVFSACVDTGQPCASATTIIRAQVNFEPASGMASRTFVQSWSVNR